MQNRKRQRKDVERQENNRKRQRKYIYGERKYRKETNTEQQEIEKIEIERK